MSERFVDVLKREINAEKAGALGRSGRRLRHALERFRDHERAHQRGTPEADARRERLLWDVAERVESLLVQREACGLRDSRSLLKFYDVPREAIARVGARHGRGR